MRCPYCQSKETEVIETRDNADLATIRRRRSCTECAKRFTTYERVENVPLIVIKSNKKREQFSREKLRSGIIKACEKTVVSAIDIEQIVSEVERQLRCGDTIEIESTKIGYLVADKLKQKDKVAYIRFASVFKHFVAIEDFEKELQPLRTIEPVAVEL